MILKRVHIIIRQPEMMADFVHDDMGNQGLQIDPGITPFVQNRAAIQVDPIRQYARLHAAFLTDRLTVVQPRQPERIIDLKLGECFLIRELLDDQHDIGEMRGERIGQPFKHAPRERFDIACSRCLPD